MAPKVGICAKRCIKWISAKGMSQNKTFFIEKQHKMIKRPLCGEYCKGIVLFVKKDVMR